MIERHNFGDITLLIRPVTPLDGESRRQSERRTVTSLIEAAFGQRAVLAHHPSGAPYLTGNPIHLSVSHCHHHACIAYSASHPVGVDIEELRPQLRRVAPRILSETELQAYSFSDSLLLQAWVLKEALYKAALIPGLDFRRDISLPLPPDSLSASVVGRPFRIDAIIPTASYTIALVHSSR